MGRVHERNPGVEVERRIELADGAQQSRDQLHVIGVKGMVSARNPRSKPPQGGAGGILLTARDQVPGRRDRRMHGTRGWRISVVGAPTARGSIRSDSGSGLRVGRPRR